MSVDLQSLIDRAAAATTLAEECEVIRDILVRDGMENIFPHVSSRDMIALQNLVSDVACLLSPRACLLGVVASLVPKNFGRFVNQAPDETKAHAGIFHPSMNEGRDVHDWACSGDCYPAATPALAVLVALCRALQEQEAQHVG